MVALFELFLVCLQPIRPN